MINVLVSAVAVMFDVFTVVMVLFQNYFPRMWKGYKNSKDY